MVFCVATLSLETAQTSLVLLCVTSKARLDAACEGETFWLFGLRVWVRGRALRSRSRMRGTSLFTAFFLYVGPFWQSQADWFLTKTARWQIYCRNCSTNVASHILMCFQEVKSHNWISQLVEMAVGSRTLAAQRDVLRAKLKDKSSFCKHWVYFNVVQNNLFPFC